MLVVAVTAAAMTALMVVVVMMTALVVMVVMMTALVVMVVVTAALMLVIVVVMMTAAGMIVMDMHKKSSLWNFSFIIPKSPLPVKAFIFAQISPPPACAGSENGV